MCSVECLIWQIKKNFKTHWNQWLSRNYSKYFLQLNRYLTCIDGFSFIFQAQKLGIYLHSWMFYFCVEILRSSVSGNPSVFSKIVSISKRLSDLLRNIDTYAYIVSYDFRWIEMYCSHENYTKYLHEPIFQDGVNWSWRFFSPFSKISYGFQFQLLGLCKLLV